MELSVFGMYGCNVGSACFVLFCALGPTDTATAFAALRDMPQFHHVRQVVRQNPNMLPALLQQIGQQNPSLLTMISQNQQAFIDMMNESDDGSAPAPQAPAGGEGVVGGQGQAGDDYRVMYVTAEEKEAIERVRVLIPVGVYVCVCQFCYLCYSITGKSRD